MSKTSRDEILNAARLAAQAHGYTGLNIRGLADEVGIKAASIYYHFPSKPSWVRRWPSVIGRIRRVTWTY